MCCLQRKVVKNHNTLFCISKKRYDFVLFTRTSNSETIDCMHVEFILQNNMHALSKIVLNNKYFDNKLKPYFQKEKNIKYILENTL